ncbi:MAG: class II aldolase/adducin family protein [Rhodothermales bacterium]|nr:class II aldolase/adducin family protein [Rhodothermales bacterium]
MDETGYIQFDNRSVKGPPPEATLISELNYWRTQCVDEGIIGVDLNGTGFGNVSVRIRGTSRFVISGTQTGALRTLSARHYTKVVDSCIDANRIVAVGPISASSEALTHAAVYRADGRVGAVIHVHSKMLWDRLVDIVPTTNRAAAAGTTAMAREIERLVSSMRGRSNIIVMGGHKEGLIAFGAGPAAAAEALFATG